MDIQNDKKKIVKQKVRNKAKIYLKERNEILKKVYNIIGITNEKKTFYSHEISESDETQKNLLELSDDILKYFTTSSWSIFKNSVDVENKSLSLIRSLFRDMDVKYISKAEKVKDDIKTHNSTLYTIESEII